jgi:hypothetical protein
MRNFKCLAAVAGLMALIVAPSLAEARSHHRHHRAHHRLYSLPYEISYTHNYGPGAQPGTFAYYDGPSTNACRQSAAVYIGQDSRRHPCF